MTVDIDNLLNVPSGKPVILWSYYRAGSTAVCDFIAKKYFYKNFDEAFHNSYPDRRDKFLQYQAGHTNFVIKIMADQWQEKWQPLQSDLWNRSYTVKLTRRNFHAQLVSWYISYHSNHWHQTKNQKKQRYTVMLDERFMKLWCTKLKNYNKTIDNYRGPFDAQIVYESFGVYNTDFTKRRRPDNYQDISECAKKVIDEINHG